MTSRLAPAKINLFLHVGDKRADGYHNLLSLVVFANVGDRLSLASADRLSLKVTGKFQNTGPAGSAGNAPDCPCYAFHSSKPYHVCYSVC